MSSFTIEAFVGENGGGKTLAMVERRALPSLAAGRPVVSNFVIRHELWRPLRSWTDIPRLGVQERDGQVLYEHPDGGRGITEAEAVELGVDVDELSLWSLTGNRGCTLLLDEITSTLPSRQAISLPAQLASQLNQLRKPDVDVGWGAPNWARADTILREVTQRVTVCRGYLPDRVVRSVVAGDRFMLPRSGPVLRDEQGRRVGTERRWEPRRLFKWSTYDARALDEFTYGAVRDVKPVERRWYWRPAHDAHLLYDTKEQVMMLDHLDDVGTCMVCGGHRSRPKCSCGVAGRVDPPEANGRRGSAQRRRQPTPSDGERDRRGPIHVPDYVRERAGRKVGRVA